MIGPVAAAILDHVVTPQTLDDVPADRRVYRDEVRPINAAPQTVEVVPVSSVFVRADIGPVPHATYRHEVDVTVTVEHADQLTAGRLRDDVVADLILRSLVVDWPSVGYGPRQEFEQLLPPTVRYAEGTLEDPQTLAAYAVLTFTVDTTVVP